MSFWAPCTISLTCNLDINGNANKQRIKPFGASTLFLFVQNQESTEAVWSCPKRLIKISNCDDWAMKEACDHLGAASTPKMAWSAPPKRITDIGSSLSSWPDWFTFIKHPSGIFPRADGDCHGCTRLLLRRPTKPITPTFVLPRPSYILTWKRSAVFFCAGEFASGGKFLMSGKCKPGQNLISGAIKRLKEVVARYVAILSILFPSPYSTNNALVRSYNICYHNFDCDVRCLVFQFRGHRSAAYFHACRVFHLNSRGSKGVGEVI